MKFINAQLDTAQTRYVTTSPKGHSVFGIRHSPNPIRRVSMPVVVGAFAGVLALTISGCEFDAPIAADPGIVNPAEAEVEPSAFTAASGVPASQNWQLTGAELDRATTLLETLPVKGRAPKTGYSRDQFGAAWTDDVDVDLGHNACDTRNDLLKRDLSNVAFKNDGKQCTVLSGTLHDPYTATRINFQRGQTTSSAVQVDHVVALSNSWQVGAQKLTERERRNLANDPRNLLAVDGPTNQKKSDGDAATWLPPNKDFRCRYVATQVDVKSTYNLWVTQAEKDAINRVLSTCATSQPVPSLGSAGS